MSRGYTIPIQYGPNGCQVEVSGNQTCRETQTLEIIKEFNRVYESKLTELGSVGGGDNLMAKLHLQQDWIRDLTQQNEMLVRAVEELEKEAADRVSMLEERLESGAQVMRKYKDNFSVYLNKTFQNLDLLQNDVCNLVEFIKRARDNGVWNTDELTFYTIDGQSLLKSESPVRDVYRSTQPDKASENVRALEDQLKEMEKRLSNCPKENDLQELNFKLHLKEEELNSLKRSSVALRDSLLCAMAEKQEEVVCLQHQLQKIELKYCVAEEQLKVKEDQVKDMEKMLINNATKESELQSECLDTEACISGTASCPELENKDKLITDLKSEMQCLKDRILYLECMKCCEEQQRKEREAIENERKEKERIENEKKQSIVIPEDTIPTPTYPETPSPKRKKSPSPKREKKHLPNCGKTLPPKQDKIPCPKHFKTPSPKRTKTPSPKRHKSHSPRRRTKQVASIQIPSESLQLEPCDCQKPKCPLTLTSDTQTLINRRIQTQGDKSGEKFEVCCCCGKNSIKFEGVDTQASHPYDTAIQRQGTNEKKSNLKSNSVENRGRCYCPRRHDLVENAELDSRDVYSTPKKLVVSSYPSKKDNVNSPYVYVCEADIPAQSRPVKEFFNEENLVLSSDDFRSDNYFLSEPASKKSCTLTSNQILHEYYGISDSSGSHGVIKNFQEVTTKVNLINVPKRTPIKAYINNLELNIKKSTTASLGIKKRTLSPIKKNKKFS